VAVQPRGDGQPVRKTITNGWVGKRAPVSGPIRGFKGSDPDFSGERWRREGGRSGTCRTLCVAVPEDAFSK